MTWVDKQMDKFPKDGEWTGVIVAFLSRIVATKVTGCGLVISQSY